MSRIKAISFDLDDTLWMGVHLLTPFNKRAEASANIGPFLSQSGKRPANSSTQAPRGA
jgi:FMN phosphatase YigB (HAD superfamily)